MVFVKTKSLLLRFVLDSDSRSQHVQRSSLTTPTPSTYRPFAPVTYPSHKTVATTRTPPKRKNSGNQASPTLPRPPTLKNITSTPPPRRTNTNKALGDIVFPDGNLFPSFVPRKDSCQGQDFCEDVPGYPMEYINKLFEESGEVFKALFDDEDDVSFNEYFFNPILQCYLSLLTCGDVALRL